MQTVIIVKPDFYAHENEPLILVSDSKSPKGLIKTHFKKARIVEENESSIIFKHSNVVYTATTKTNVKIY